MIKVNIIILIEKKKIINEIIQTINVNKKTANVNTQLTEKNMQI